MNKRIGTGILILAFLTFLPGCNQAAKEGEVAQTTSPAPVPQPPLAPGAASTPAAPPNPEDQMRRIRADEAIKMAKAGDALIIDVRGTESFNTQHIKGALDFSLQRIEAGDFKGLPHNKLIIAYCA